jgi:hypothetical protein
MSHAPALATSVKALTRSVLFDLVCDVRPIVFKLLAVGSASGLVLGILASRCWLRSCTKQLPAIRWRWLVSSWPCR